MDIFIYHGANETVSVIHNDMMPIYGL